MRSCCSKAKCSRSRHCWTLPAPHPRPPRAGAVEVDAAFAALAEYLAEHDGWQTPGWALDASRRTAAWYPAVPTIFRADADQESPEAFRRRGILITSRSLARA